MTSRVRSILGGADDDATVSSASESFPVDNRIYVGFVSQEKEGNVEIGPNIARGKDCWGRMVPEGSVSPGRM